MNDKPFIPKRLIEARLASGMSMSGLAEHCDVTAQAISAYESGLRNPSPSTLFQLATNLGVPMHYLTTERASDSGAAGPIFFRSIWDGRTKREYDRRAQHAVWAGEVSNWIDQFVKLPDVALTDVCEGELDDAKIELIALNLRQAWGLGTSPITNLARLLETKGIVVVRQQVENSKVDAYSRIVLGRPIVFLSDNKKSAVRSRFDAAHELGHLVMHRKLSQCEITASGGLARIEKEANRFAAAFLMPAESFGRELYGTTLQSFVNLKLRWKVSLQAMIFRAQQLSLVSETQKQSLFTQIGARGMRVKEPLDNSIVIEEPLLLRRAWEMIVNNAVQSKDAICEALALRREVVARILRVPLEKLIGVAAEDNIVEFSLRTPVSSGNCGLDLPPAC